MAERHELIIRGTNTTGTPGQTVYLQSHAPDFPTGTYRVVAVEPHEEDASKVTVELIDPTARLMDLVNEMQQER